MKSTKKFFAALLIFTIVSLLLMPFSAFAKAGTLGEETPELYCRFSDAAGQAVDGNALSAGTYTVEVMLAGMETFSVFQFTAKTNYQPSVLTSLEVASVYTGAQNEVSCGGIKQDTNGNLVVALASENSDCSALDAEGTAMATMTVTVATSNSVDFQEVFRFVQDPDLTFAEADYGDGINDAYVLDTSVQTGYAKYAMTADESPSLSETVNVEGHVFLASDVYGTPSDLAWEGITLSTTVGDETIEAVTDANGAYVLRDLPFGTYTVLISGETTIDRTVTLQVTPERANAGSISANDVGIIVVDYSGDKIINSLDVTTYNSYYNKAYVDAAYYVDFNNDRVINSLDTVYFNVFYNKICSYDEVTI